MPSSPQPERTRRRRPPRLVLAVTLVWVGLLGVWSVTAPLGEAPDETAHLGLVLHLADGNGYPDYDALQHPFAILRLCRTYAAATRACPLPGEVVTADSIRLHPRADAPDRAGRPAWDDLGDRSRLAGQNQMPQHPPLYYAAMAVSLRGLRGVAGHPLSVDRELAFLRLLNVLVLAPLPILAWWAARRLGAEQQVAVVSALLVLAMPQLAHIGSTLNNDNLLTLLGAVIVALLAGVVVGDRSLRTALWLGVTITAAVLTKAFGVVFVPAAVLAYVIGWWPGPAAGRRGRRLRELAVPVGALVAVVTVGAGAWFLRVHARTGRFLPTIEDQRLTSALRPPGFRASPLTFAHTFLGELSERYWGSFGWYTARLPGWLTLACSVVLLVLIAVGVRTGVGPRRAPLVGLLAPAVLLVLLVFVQAWRLYLRTSLFKFIQGRYLFAAITGIVVVAAVGLVRLTGRWAVVAAALGSALLQAAGLHTALARYWGGPGLGPRGQVRALLAWGAWPPAAVAAWWCLTLVAMGLLAHEVRRWWGRGPVVSGVR